MACIHCINLCDGTQLKRFGFLIHFNFKNSLQHHRKYSKVNRKPRRIATNHRLLRGCIRELPEDPKNDTSQHCITHFAPSPRTGRCMECPRHPRQRNRPRMGGKRRAHLLPRPDSQAHRNRLRRQGRRIHRMARPRRRWTSPLRPCRRCRRCGNLLHPPAT